MILNTHEEVHTNAVGKTTKENIKWTTAGVRCKYEKCFVLPQGKGDKKLV